MTLRISGKHLDIGDAMRTHVHDRVDTMAKKYFGGTMKGHVTVEHEGSGYRTDCTLHLSSGMTLQADGIAHEPYASFEQAAARIEKRLRRYKSRLKDHHSEPVNSAASTMVAPGAVANYSIIESPHEDDEPVHDFSPVVIAEMTSHMKEMAVSAAVIELDLSGAPVVVFRHAGHGRVNIVYRRKDGNIGWVDPSGS